MRKHLISFQLNTMPVSVEVTPDTRLIDVLREHFRLTGTKEGCGEGECGACMILLDGSPTLSCLMAIGAIDGKRVTTIEGLREAPGFAILAQAFSDAGAVQCGYCTPGMIMIAYALLRDQRTPDESSIRRAMAGNLCRCTGYAMIVEAIRLASARRGPSW
jgi:carbon-monoxide dehydrogenase small subunit